MFIFKKLACSYNRVVGARAALKVLLSMEPHNNYAARQRFFKKLKNINAGMPDKKLVRHR
jgi:hypothetical protein